VSLPAASSGLAITGAFSIGYDRAQLLAVVRQNFVTCCKLSTDCLTDAMVFLSSMIAAVP
jgi:hypothetical protein